VAGWRPKLTARAVSSARPVDDDLTLSPSVGGAHRLLRLGLAKPPRHYVRFEADIGDLLVDAPAGALSGQDRAALAEAKPELLRMLAPGAGEKPEDDGRRFDARPSRRPGYTSLNGPIE
jgi:hypothetical protein